MKDEYFTPVADMLAFDYANVVSASFDTRVVPNQHNANQCETGPVKQNIKHCSGDNPVKPNKNKGQKC